MKEETTMERRMNTEKKDQLLKGTIMFRIVFKIN